MCVCHMSGKISTVVWCYVQPFYLNPKWLFISFSDEFTGKSTLAKIIIYYTLLLLKCTLFMVRHIGIQKFVIKFSYYHVSPHYFCFIWLKSWLSRTYVLVGHMSSRKLCPWSKKNNYLQPCVQVTYSGQQTGSATLNK